MADAATIALTDFHNRPGEAIDRSQAGPVTLTKRNRPYAVIVSAEWFGRAEQAMEGLHGHRRVLDADNLADADRDFVMAHGPTEDEIATGKWRA